MASRKIKYEFYSIIVPDNVDLWSTLDSSLPNSKIVYKRGQPLRIQSYSNQNGLRVGCAAKIKMDNLPLVASLENLELQSLGLEDDQGVTSLTSFVIVPKYNALVLQRNTQGVRAASFLHLLIAHSGIDDLELEMMLEPDVISKLNRMQVIRKFELRVATPTDRTSYKDLSHKEAVTLAQYYGGRKVTIEVSMGRGATKEGLVVENVKKSVKQLLKMREEESVQVESLLINGKELADEECAPLDLINQRLICEVEVPQRGRELLQEDLELAAQKAYNEKREIVSKYKRL